MRLILLTILLCFTLHDITKADDNEEEVSTEESEVLTVYEIDFDPYTKEEEEENDEEDGNDTTGTTGNTDTTTDGTTTNTNPSTTKGSTTMGSTITTTNGLPLCTTLLNRTPTMATGSTGQTGPTTEGSTVSFNTESTTYSGTTEQECIEVEEEVVESTWKYVPVRIEEDPIGKLPEEWSMCASKFMNIWRNTLSFDSFGSWISSRLVYDIKHRQKHSDREDLKLHGYLYISNVIFCLKSKQNLRIFMQGSVSSTTRLDFFHKFHFESWWHYCWGFDLKNGNISLVVNGDIALNSFNKYMLEVKMAVLVCSIN